jgi:iron complex transport system ATP-binding protein
MHAAEYQTFRMRGRANVSSGMERAADPDSAPLIVGDDLGVRLGRAEILRGVSFSIAAGEWVGLLGPNGSGKTTLLRTLAGLLPYDGRLDLRGRPIRAWRAGDLARTLAFVRQAPTFAFDLSVRDLVLLGRAPHKRLLESWHHGDHDRVERALAQVDLEGFASRSILQLSGGERQRAFLAQAMVQEADILLLDEPTAHLDVHHQYEFLERIHELSASGRTVVSVFHDLELALRYAHRVIVVEEGLIAASGAPEEVLTAGLIESVFRMRARVEAPRIFYQAPV